MRIAFMGTPDFSVPVLSELLAAGHEIAAVYTRAPQPAGRGHKLRPSPVEEFAREHGLEVRIPKNFKSDDDRAAFAALDLDVAVVVAYGLLLPQAILEAPRFGCLNLHASLLPRWRGAAPIQRAIMAGDTQTGVQVMQMEKGLDTGPVLLSEVTPIAGDDTAQSLHDRLSHIGAQLAPRALAALERGALTPTPQPDDGVTYAEKISPSEARINWSAPAPVVDFHIRGLSPFPGAWFTINGERVKALMSSVAEQAYAGSTPGEVLASDDSGIVVACAKGAVLLTSLQRAGKRRQSAQEFLRGFAVNVGSAMG